jgi:hypothetical protein
MLSRPLFPLGQEQENIANTFIEENEKDKNKDKDKDKDKDKKEKNKITILTFSDYIKDKNVLKKYKLPELKQISKFYKLFITGTKKVLLERIENLFSKFGHCIKIQKMVRGYLTRQSFHLRGKAFSERSICVNENDFYTLEPLGEIPNQYFFTFQSGKFIYGCNIISLIHLIKSKTLVKNPYNRENLSFETIQNIVRLYRLINIIFGLPSDAPVIKDDLIIQNKKSQESNPFIVNREQINRSIVSVRMIEDRIQKMRTIRMKPLSERIREIFIEMDQLGNYTHSQWFSSLDRYQYIRLFRTMYEIWMFRGGLTRETKYLISIITDPFLEINRERIHLHDSTVEVLQDVCLKIMENMVYGGADDEYRKIGALHVLTALTNASLGARSALPWLYDTLY